MGAGLVGLAVARHLARQGHDVTVFDKERAVAQHQSGHNSGVVHAGVYYAPGSLKAALTRRGVQLLRAVCADHGIEYREVGKVVVALDDEQRGQLSEIERRAISNGVPGVRLLDRAALREIEPNVAGVAALHSPTTAIVDYRAVAQAMVEDIEARGGRVVLGAAVTAIDTSSTRRVELVAGDQVHHVDRLIICAGLHADTVARLAGDAPGPVIVPFRGEYYRLVPEKTGLVRGLVYPVPDPAYPFLGVHVTPRIDGSVDIGPNAVPAAAREGYRFRDVGPSDLRQMLGWPGTRKLIRAHWRAGIREIWGSRSKRAFVAAAAAYLPALRAEDVVRAPAGVRAQAVDADGGLVDDFRISHLGRVTAVRNAPSPAATASLAIAEHIVADIAAQPGG